jgi:hypothetical protein
MNTIKTFCAENNIITDKDGVLFLEGCGTILSFMYEFGFSYTEEDFHYVKALHEGTSPEMGLWTEKRSEHNWMSALQSIKTFPTYSVLVEVKEKIEAVIHQWVAAW